MTPDSAASSASLVAGIFGGELDGMAHVKGRARSQRRHIIGREIGVGMDHANFFSANVQVSATICAMAVSEP